MDSNALRAVSSAQRASAVFIIVVVLHLTLMFFAALSGSVFLDLRCTNCHFCRCIIHTVFGEFDRRENELRIVVLVAIIPLIDRASNDDSNGGYIIIWHFWTSAVKIRLSAGFCKLLRFS